MEYKEFKEKATELAAGNYELMRSIQKSGSPLEKVLVDTILEHAEVQ